MIVVSFPVWDQAFRIHLYTGFALMSLWDFPWKLLLGLCQCFLSGFPSMMNWYVFVVRVCMGVEWACSPSFAGVIWMLYNLLLTLTCWLRRGSFQRAPPHRLSGRIEASLPSRMVNDMWTVLPTLASSLRKTHCVSKCTKTLVIIVLSWWIVLDISIGRWCDIKLTFNIMYPLRWYL